MSDDTGTVPRFGPAAEEEPTVYGASRPGYPLHRVPPEAVTAWAAMR